MCNCLSVNFNFLFLHNAASEVLLNKQMLKVFQRISFWLLCSVIFKFMLMPGWHCGSHV